MKPSYPSWVLPLVGFAGAVFGAIVITAIFISMSPQARVRSMPPVPTPPTLQGDLPPTDLQVPTSTETQSGDQALPTVQDPSQRMELHVDWTDPLVFTRSQIREYFQSATTVMQQSGPINDYHEVTLGDMWRAGTVSGGAYDGAEVDIIRIVTSGMGEYYSYQHLIRSPGSDRVFAVHDKMLGGEVWNEATYSDLRVNVTELPNVWIPSLGMPATLEVGNGKTIALQSDIMPWNSILYRHEFKASTLHLIGTTADARNVYTVDGEAMTGCLIVFAEDGQEVRYASRLKVKANPDGSLASVAHWESGFQNTETYTDRLPGGCGQEGCSNIVDAKSVGPLTSLAVAGKTDDGEVIYIPKDPKNNSLVKKAYDQWFAYPSEEGAQKPSLDEFVKAHPTAVLFWKDAFGRWVELISSSALPPVECGKPVIYLYPTTTTNVRVALPSFINVTVSNPWYATSGWMTVAEPNGQLTVNGESYGSLYWEGTGVSYAPPKTGFVVKNGNVDVFLAKTLPKYGLIQKEAQEFRDFWVPKMTGVAPYYRISFLTTEWSNAAPLYVSPAPKTSIRIFMDWSPLSRPMSIKAPRIVTPSRNGFTLVEWGGTLYK